MSFIQKLNSREKILFSLTVFAAVFGILSKFVFFPKWDTYKKNIITIQAKHLKIAKLKKTLSSLQQKKINSSDSIKNSNDCPTTPIDSAKILGSIESIQKLSGIQINKLSPLPIETINEFQILPIKIEIEDTMKNIVKFSYDLNSSIHKINIRRIRLFSSENPSGMLRASVIYSYLTKPFEGVRNK